MNISHVLDALIGSDNKGSQTDTPALVNRHDPQSISRTIFFIFFIFFIVQIAIPNNLGTSSSSASNQATATDLDRGHHSFKHQNICTSYLSMSLWIRRNRIKTIEFSPIISPQAPCEADEGMSASFEALAECELKKDQGHTRIRPATLNDLPAVADIVAVAMQEDEVFRFLCPNIHKFYNHYRDGILRRIKQKLCTPGWIVCVAVYLDLSDIEIRERAIMGYAVWERIGENEHAKRWQKFGGGFWNGEDPIF
jgi:hypothetical protein